MVLLNSDMEIIAKFYRFLILQNDRKLMWQKQQHVGRHMACAPFVYLVEWKIWKRRTRVCWAKNSIIYNLWKMYQMKDIQSWTKSLKSVRVWVIEKSYKCALALCSCKNNTENFDRHVTDVVTAKLTFDRNSISVLVSFLWLPWHQFEQDVWSWLLASFRVRDKIS